MITGNLRVPTVFRNFSKRDAVSTVIFPSADIHSGQFGSQIGLLPRTTANCMDMSGSGDCFFFAASAMAGEKKQTSISSAGTNQTRSFPDLAHPLRCNEFASAQLY
ncbi:hypothetical protein SAZ10_19040 [Mesorhizobium sp. BAC0120]|uniref:hypothetical protein n=1 Tax=Mesorhizobium sp. BAC0120 TaxID=3090670 RepID=UPI00298D175F|nr:hypothetical protein [Mesorhizobium sp. BAC0120]MDW6023849.1 hypothetical protein [Mesorhizobium sp. BAC0120]